MTVNVVSDKEYVDFDVIAENWSAYELEDKTILRTKTVLMSIASARARKKKKKSKSALEILLLVVIDSGKNRGPLGEKWDVSELEKYVTESNMMFRQIKDGGPSVYETKKTRILMRPIVKQVLKTSKFDLKGNPAYIVKCESEIIFEKKVAPKNKVENIQANAKAE